MVGSAMLFENLLVREDLRGAGESSSEEEAVSGSFLSAVLRRRDCDVAVSMGSEDVAHRLSGLLTDLPPGFIKVGMLRLVKTAGAQATVEVLFSVLLEAGNCSNFLLQWLPPWMQLGGDAEFDP